jgi:hypothetical protein
VHDRASEDAIGRLSDAVALWRVCAAPASDVVDAAVECLVADADSPALRELAGMSPRESRFILDPLIDQALDELGADRLVAANPQRAALTAVLKRYTRGGTLSRFGHGAGAARGKTAGPHGGDGVPRPYKGGVPGWARLARTGRWGTASVPPIW